MHPITIIEILVALGIFVVVLVLGHFWAKRNRKAALVLVAFVAVAEIGFFIIRPLWIDYHLGIKTEQLEEYLEEKYPGETFEISRRTSRNYNPYHLEVRFENEPGWSYSYSVNDGKIKQVGIGVPDDELPEEGLHYDDL
ncbi:hypothetical protein [Mesobacillus subterraneus]|uniref:DUF3139 domain-containing protein n=1 Tax=Mesobacillus subterraneus TaxID=285983 RepID=A0A427TZA7_9BACI|nr:hypothetical protein [Mesobacillus subterraneus]RSD29580.1 hypothetical protein EJA10_00275 [Mesobacillus subterraneus]